jgi:tetratricopeptide (TPR) repeat protein
VAPKAIGLPMTDPTIHEALETAARHHRAGELPAAEKIYRQVLALQPNDPDALHLLGVLAAQVGNAEAIPLLRKAIAQRPEFPEAYAHLGNALHMRGEIGEAITCYRRAVALLPEFPEAWSNLGNALTTAGETEEAVRCCRRALSQQPGFPEARNNLGEALRSQGKVDESIVEYRAAIAIDRNFANAHGNLAQALLQRGELEEGYREYEWRWRCDSFQAPRRSFAQPLWDGSDLRGRTILIHAEQGIGDTIQMLRFVPKVIEKGGRVIVECAASMVRLLKEATFLSGVTVVSSAAQAAEKFDVHLPMMSLPFALGVRSVADIPGDVPYLSTRPRALEASGLKVGLVWSGSAAHVNDRNRSIPLQLLSPLARHGVSFHSLQVGEAAREARLGPAGMTLIDMSGQIHDFADTAEIIAALDLVICVDTAVAHLAGAMGRRVWVLLPFVADFRWMLDREDSPWYPTMHLFRQKRPSDWGQVISTVGMALDEEINGLVR